MVVRFPRSEPISISLVPARTVIEGEVRDQAGVPVAGASVRLSHPQRLAFDDVYATKTDRDGRFRAAIPQGNYVIRAERRAESAEAVLINTTARC
jgi:5-hydroxyisourate hydrolase-like protein (transthyretin family)